MKHLFITPLLLCFGVASALAQGVNFGVATGVGDHEIFIGQPASPGEKGIIHVFQRSLDGEGWSTVAKLSASDGAAGDLFGAAMQVDADVLAVGAPSPQDGNGAVYVFQRDEGTGGWSEVAKLSSEDDKVGGSLALMGDMIVTSGPTGGAAIIFTKDADMWREAGRLVGSDTQEADRFGVGLTIDEDRIYVGAPGRKEGAGAVYVFGADGFEEQAMLESGDSTLVGLGVSIGTPAPGLLISSAPGLVPNVQPTGPPPPGAIVAFRMGNDGAWMKEAVMQAAEGASMNVFGVSFVAVDDKLLIASPGANGLTGVVHVFEMDAASGGYAETGQIDAEDGYQLFGLSVTSNGAVAVISAPGTNFGEGAADVIIFDSETGEAIKDGRLGSVEGEIELVASGPVDCADGIAWQFGCSNVDLLSFLPTQDIGGAGGVQVNDIWGWTDPQTSHEYALVGRTNGVAFVDITDPLHPSYLGDLPLTDGANTSVWRDIKVYDNHAFVVADNAGSHGVQVFDLTQLRDPGEAPVTFEETARYEGIFSAHNIVINESTGFAFAVGSSGGGETCGGGLHMINIQNPTYPTFAGCFADDGTGRAGTGYSHDAQCVTYQGPDTEHSGKEICFGSNETALSIADITDKENPVSLANASYPNVAYAHQGWLTHDHAHFYMNDELDELQGEVIGTRTLIWDVTDLDDPQLLEQRLSENKSSDHNLYIRGDLMYQSNYLSGLRILDISDVTNPVEVGFFDTVPLGDDRPGFGGSWSNYPYFESGAIIITSMNEGLFVLKKRGIDT